MNAQRGFAIVSAVFLMVVLGLLGAMLVTLSATQHVGQTRDLLGVRARYAARAGIDWGAYQALRGASCPASASLPPLAGAAARFSVRVACSASGPYDEAGHGVMIYQLTATATSGTPGTPDYAERELKAIVSAPWPRP